MPLAEFKTTEALDFKKIFTINWACMWNNINYVGKQCHIVASSTMFTLVYIPEVNDISLYRNEDLS